VLAKRPDDTAAIHYYIHATEFGGHAREALPYAERLAELAPAASHLVHMGAHTMMRVGQYQDVAVTNAAALKVDSVQKTQGYANAPTAGRYYSHNFQFGLAGAMMSGDRALALKYAEHGARVYPTGKATGYEFSQARALLGLGRYAPERALAVPETAGDTQIWKIYRHYARGEAYAALKDAPAADREAAALAKLVDQTKSTPDPSSNIAAIASHVVAGRAAMVRGDWDGAAERFAQAAAIQKDDFPVYDNFDPPPWWYPVRRSLAAAHLKAGRHVTAAREARQSLVEWPQDALALRVLAEAEAAMGQKDDARRHAAEARRHWQGDLAKMPIDLT
jgi:tetratricopeptide (TPR) repeat protein